MQTFAIAGNLKSRVFIRRTCCYHGIFLRTGKSISITVKLAIFTWKCILLCNSPWVLNKLSFVNVSIQSRAEAESVDNVPDTACLLRQPSGIEIYFSLRLPSKPGYGSITIQISAMILSNSVRTTYHLFIGYAAPAASLLGIMLW